MCQDCRDRIAKMDAVLAEMKAKHDDNDGDLSNLDAPEDEND